MTVKQEEGIYIAFEGNIGAGKTTLCSRISEIIKSQKILEKFEDNPFLPYFYRNMEEYALALELVFLTERVNQLRKLSPPLFSKMLLCDFTIYKSFIFGRVTLKEWKFEIFRRIFNLLAPTVPTPSLIIYIYREIPELIKNIKRRGRPYEMSITEDYLFAIEESYEHFFKFHCKHPVITINASGKDLLLPETLQKIIDSINEVINTKKSIALEV